jgi:hypothetical protein
MTEVIQKQAKEILEMFSKAIEKVDVKETVAERANDRRKEGIAKAEIDKKIMFFNAPKARDNCIEAERGDWV